MTGKSNILAYSKARRIRSLFCTQWPSSRDGDDAGGFERADGSQFLAGDIFGDGARDEDVDFAFARRPFANQRDGARVVDGGGGVGHANDGGETAPGGRGRAGGDGFLGGLSRFAQMRVQINQSRADHQSAGLKPLNLRRRARRRGRGRRRRFFPPQQEHPPRHRSHWRDRSRVPRSGASNSLRRGYTEVN